MRSKLSLLALACLCLACVAAGAKAVDANTKEKAGAKAVGAKAKEADVSASAAGARAKTAGADTTNAKSSDAQDAKSQLIVPMQSGAFVLIRTESVPSAAHDSTSNLVESEDKPNLIHRIFVDSKNELFFGYELLVELVPSTRQFRVTVRPLSEEYLRALNSRPAFQKRRLHPSYNAAAFNSAPQLIGDGDTFTLDVLQSPRTGAKIVDVVTVSLSDPGLQEPVSDSPARDLTLEDVPLKVTNYRLRVGGETIYRTTSGCAGALVWFALPGSGRFVFSLVPRPGYDFRKVGAVRHNTISFEWDGVSYEWESALPVVGTGGNWNLWVLHDADYQFDLFEQPARAEGSKPSASKIDDAVRGVRQRQARGEFGSPSQAPATAPTPPTRQHVRVIIGAADSVEYLFPKK
jgi:hypothetical protein